MRVELQTLAEAVWALRDHVTVQSAAVAAGAGSAPSRPIAADLAENAGERGTVVSRGVVRGTVEGQEVRWDQDLPVEQLLDGENADAAAILASIGHKQRLAIAKVLLASPTTAADLVTRLELGTTGAAYHHLNVLQAAGMVTQESRGVFAIHPGRVSILVTILAGVASAPGSTLVAADDSGESTSGKRRKRKLGDE